ncbi:hypothetical protein Pa4123_22420 [Phytohabitans aurantiacus]|uniref:Uncharacterized protein n=1 Tax=Phytohabitans aurantiacus TaxID=3016789 RepID=A0ABQ5QQR0_9ACTN|nr:hypothetical protein Pa4123_22420 [Phytohabitans aurantiacus]
MLDVAPEERDAPESLAQKARHPRRRRRAREAGLQHHAREPDQVTAPLSCHAAIVNKLFYFRVGQFSSMETSWYDIPAVRVVGAILGTLLLVAAIRSMFGKGR